ncbi:MAG: tetratricopeptide repeat protein [Bacteroidetes bacterium]|nr:tetratricopeptide repeat protein [Bacteroidota bacterium]
MMDRMAQLKELIKQFPDDMFSRHALAMEYLKSGEDNRAKEVMLELLSKDPGHIGTYYHLGKLYERMGDLHQAKKVYTTGIDTAQTMHAAHELRELNAALNNLLDLIEE